MALKHPTIQAEDSSTSVHGDVHATSLRPFGWPGRLTWASPAKKAVKARSKSFVCLTFQRFSHRYSQTAFLYRRRVSLITQAMPIPLSQTDAQIHTIRCKRRTPKPNPPSPKKRAHHIFDRNASTTPPPSKIKSDETKKRTR